MKHQATVIALSSLMVTSALLSTGGNTFAATQHTSRIDATFKVGLVADTGGINDHGFNQLAYDGVIEAHKKFGIEYTVAQTHQSSEYVSKLTKFARLSYNLVIAVGYPMESAVRHVSKNYPGIKFLIIDDAIANRKNVMSALFNSQQSGFLVGVLAGLMNQQKHILQINGKNVIGIIGGQDIPPVESYITGIEAGVKKVDPKATILKSFAKSFSSPKTGRKLALSQISKGADIVFQAAGGTGLGVIEAAKQKGVFAIGVDANQNYLAPNTVMTSALKEIDVAVLTAVSDTLHNRFKSGVVNFDLADKGVGYVKPIKVVPVSAVKKVNSFIPLLNSGKIKLPTLLPKH